MPASVKVLNALVCYHANIAKAGNIKGVGVGEIIIEGVEIFEAIPDKNSLWICSPLPFAPKHTSFTFGPETNARAA